MNRRSYDAIRDDWDAARSGLAAYEPRFLELLIRDVRPPARFLDLGCGTGRPIAEFLLQRGFAVTGIDQSEGLLALAASRLPRGHWRLARMETFEPDERYDGAVIWDSLFHIAREHHEAILRRVLGSLLPRARVMMTVGGSDHPPFTDTMYGQPFFYDSHAPDAVVSMLTALGASIVHAEFINPPTGGRDKGRYGIVAQSA